MKDEVWHLIPVKFSLCKKAGVRRFFLICILLIKLISKLSSENIIRKTNFTSGI